MTTPAAFDPAIPQAAQTRLRPKPAATLILWRQGHQGLELLMGQRAQALAFMPGKWVFPGGRVDRADLHLARRHALQLDPHTKAQLLLNIPAAHPPHFPAALILAAIRETFEETGLRLGQPTPSPLTSPDQTWRAFLRTGLWPDLRAFQFVARAITPPGRPRRFDARFFLAPATLISNHPAETPASELSKIDWLLLKDIHRLDLPAITRFVLEKIPKAIEDPSFVPSLILMRGQTHVEHPLIPNLPRV